MNDLQDLGEKDKEDARKDSGGFGLLGGNGAGDGCHEGMDGFAGLVTDDVLDEGSAETNQADAGHDDEQGEPLVEIEMAAKEYDRKKTDPEDEGPAGHLVDGNGGVSRKEVRAVRDLRQKAYSRPTFISFEMCQLGRGDVRRHIRWCR